MSAQPGFSYGDRTTKSKIRDAAIGLFARDGVEKTTVRAIAAAADVSPGLVIHHYGSKQGLVHACDQHVASLIHEGKSEAMQGGPGFDVLGALRESGGADVMRYLAKRLVAGSDEVAQLVDQLVSDAEQYLEQGVEAGMLKPSTDPHGRAVILTIWSLGALVLHEHLGRLVGSDLTAPDVMTDGSIMGYFGPATEVLTEGLVTEAMAETIRQALAGLPERQQTTT